MGREIACATCLLVLVAGCSLERAPLLVMESDTGLPPLDTGVGDPGMDVGPDVHADAMVADARVDGRADAARDGGEEGGTPDASIDTMEPPPTWTVIETLTVDSASSEPVYSSTALEAGVVYRLRASGTITNVIGTHQGDADYYDFSDPKDNGCCEDIGLGIDDLVVDDLDTQPDWGPYDPTHVYEVEWTGDGTTISALFQDTYYGNNIGSLTLEILALR